MHPRDRTLAIAACSVALGSLVPVALYQSGVLERLPDPPGSAFDSERVTSSQAAHPFGIPDSYLGLCSYAMTLGLLMAERRNQSARKLLGAKLVVDGTAAGFNTVRQVIAFRKICSWCTGTALATGVMVYAGRAAVRAMLQAGRGAD